MNKCFNAFPKKITSVSRQTHTHTHKHTHANIQHTGGGGVGAKPSTDI